jgi:uncharacterized protein DUF2726
MSSLFAFAIIIGVIGGLGIAVQSLLKNAPKKRSRSGSTAAEPNWQPPKGDLLPYAKKNYVFSAAERSFYEILRRLVTDYVVFAKMRLCDLVYVTKDSGSWQTNFNRINRKHLDFVICNKDLAPVVAIELDDASHDAEDREERDDFVDAVLRAASLPLVRIRAKRSYVLDELRELLKPHLDVAAKSSADVPNPHERFAPPKGWRPAV